MNPWPDGYTNPPDELAARRCWGVAHKSATGLDAMVLLEVAHYLHWLTEEHRGLQAVCDEQAAELARLDIEGGA